MGSAIVSDVFEIVSYLVADSGIRSNGPQNVLHDNAHWTVNRFTIPSTSVTGETGQSRFCFSLEKPLLFSRSISVRTLSSLHSIFLRCASMNTPPLELPSVPPPTRCIALPVKRCHGNRLAMRQAFDIYLHIDLELEDFSHSKAFSPIPSEYLRSSREEMPRVKAVELPHSRIKAEFSLLHSESSISFPMRKVSTEQGQTSTPSSYCKMWIGQCSIALSRWRR